MGKVNDDLEKMNKDRRKAEEAYLESVEKKLEVERIKRDGISNAEDLVIYISDVVESVQHSEDLARMNNNPIVYSEAIGIRREMNKLFLLLMRDEAPEEVMDGTEEAHREKNDGEEGYT